MRLLRQLSVAARLAAEADAGRGVSGSSQVDVLPRVRKADWSRAEQHRLWVERVCRYRWLPEREHVRLGAGLEERDLQRSFADSVVLAHDLVQASVAEQAVPVLVDVHAV